MIDESMSDDKMRIAELERQVMDLRKAAVAMVVGMSDAITPTPGARDELALKFDELAEEEPGETRHLAQLVASALRSRW